MSGKVTNDRDTKHSGAVYTPAETVRTVLDVAGYVPDADIVGKAILEPSCGDGAFLVEIASRLLTACERAGMSRDEMRHRLIGDVHAIEIDTDECERARERMCEVASGFGVEVSPSQLVNIVTGDAIATLVGALVDDGSIDSQSFDFVVGNPPYVRIHNADTSVMRRLSWCAEGMTDMYYAFFELGYRVLSRDGTLCYIAPSSWFTSKAGRAMRDELRGSHALSEIVDYGHEQVFDGITAYTAITRLTTRPNDRVRYCAISTYRTGGEPLAIPSDECYVSGMLMPAPDDVRDRLSDMFASDADAGVRVKTGYQTSLNSFYVRKDHLFDAVSIPCVKASTGRTESIIFPYRRGADGTIEPMSPDEIMAALGDEAGEIILDNENALRSRSKVDGKYWLSYARTQGIEDTFVDKVTVNNLYRDANDVKLVEAPAGTGVYGIGAYVTGMGIDDLREALSDELFWVLVRSLRKYKNGGYYTIDNASIERYLNYWASERKRAASE